MMDNSKTVLSGANSTYLLGLLEQYQNDPNSINSDWHPILAEMAKGEARPTWGQVIQRSDVVVDVPKQQKSQNHELQIQVIKFIDAYRQQGHKIATLDPLKLNQTNIIDELNPKTYGITDEHYSTSFETNGAFGFQNLTFNEIYAKLKAVYCGNLSAELTHISNSAQRKWLQEVIEQPKNLQYAKKEVLEQLTKAEFFERFLHVKFPGAKRFGLDGGESLIPALNVLVKIKAEQGVQNIIFGMAHRGRLSTMVNILNKPASDFFLSFKGYHPHQKGSGDVKYHMGYEKQVTVDGKIVNLSLAYNPSHLECVNPVVLGQVRAKENATAVLIHGDAAFIGQGVVFETLGLSKLKGYKTDGTLHIIINNQVGFTTRPQEAKSCYHSSDLAKFIEAPILHVNGDDVEAVLRAIHIACAYQNMFKQDIVINLVCYRRNGHNEGDEPAFTQPLMYQTIKNHLSAREQYESFLIKTEVLTKQEAQTLKDDVDYWLKNEFEKEAKKEEPTLDIPTDMFQTIRTGVDEKILKDLGLKLFTAPLGFHLNSKILRQWNEKKELITQGRSFDWQMGEALAFASCLIENHSVRLSGQDCERGTFSQRHGVVVDQESEQKYMSFAHLKKDQAHIEILNSSLSEFAVMGYEYGFSLAQKTGLTMWEGQFGDFVNGAQVIIDQFLSSAETKWAQHSNLALLLPHGLEGQGPEHSSARLERFLQLCAEDNMIVANCSTPANYFHILRRQIKAPYKKPLVLMTPKSLLRHKLCVSDLKDFSYDTHFKPIISDLLPPQTIRKIILCSGKVYYDLLEYRESNHIKDVALIRLEQFYPFPEAQLIQLFKAYNNIPVIWCQEEPKNMGAWSFLNPYLENVLTKVRGEFTRSVYVGRKNAASPATGFLDVHKKEQDILVQEAFS